MINEKTKRLIREFVESESRDYTLNKNKVWIDTLTRKIVNKLKTRDYGQLKLVSTTNLGLIDREFILHFRRGSVDLEVLFCTCGELNHWGQFIEVKHNG